MKVVLEAGSEITFKVGGSFVKLDPGGVTLVGPSVKMNSGGSAGQGSGARPLVPGETVASEVADKGKLLVQAQRQALMRAAPRCDICLQPEQPALAREGTGQWASLASPTCCSTASCASSCCPGCICRMSRWRLNLCMRALPGASWPILVLCWCSHCRPTG